MIYIDDRIGSKELLPHIPKKLSCLTHLDYADAAFLGRGPDDNPISIGIERKRINDLITSMTSGRLSGHQLPGLRSAYDVVYLVVEGLWRANPRDGILEKPIGGGWRPIQLGARRFMAKEIWSYLNTLQICGGVLIWKSGSERATGQWLVNLYYWWNSKSLDEHKSHEALHIPIAQLSTKKPSIVQRVAATLPGVGFNKSKEIAQKFSTVQEMVLAMEGDWLNVPGIGKTLARRITKALTQEEQ